MSFEIKKYVSERHLTNESERSLNEDEKKTNKLKNVYLVMSLLKTGIGLYIIYENKVEISTTSEETKKHMFEFIILYTFLWPLALVFSTFFFVGIHFIDIILQITKPRRNKAITQPLNGDLESNLNNSNFNTFSNSRFFLTTIISFIIVFYVVSIPAGSILLWKVITRKLLTKGLVYYKIFAFYGLNFVISVFVLGFLVYYTCYLRTQKKKLEIDDVFLQSIEKKENETRYEDNFQSSGHENLFQSSSQSAILRPSHRSGTGTNNAFTTPLRGSHIKNSNHGSTVNEMTFGNNVNNVNDINALKKEEIEKVKGNYTHKNMMFNSMDNLSADNFVERAISPRKSKNQIVDYMKSYYSPQTQKGRIEKKEDKDDEGHIDTEFEIDLVVRKELPKKVVSTKKTTKIMFDISENTNQNDKSGISDSSEKHKKNNLEIKRPRTPRKLRKTIII